MPFVPARNAAVNYQVEAELPATGSRVGNSSRSAKYVLLHAARAMRAFTVVAGSSWRRRRLLILGYHGLSLQDEHEWDPFLFHNPETFRRRLLAIREAGCTVLPLAEGLVRLQDGTLPHRSVVITFDDGLHDFKAVAMPMLAEFGFPATIYVSTYYVDQPMPVFAPWCRYLLWKARVPSVDLTAVIGRGGVHSLSSPAELEEAAAVLRRFGDAERLNGAAKDEVARRLEAVLPVDAASLRAQRILQFMTTGELRDVVAAGADVQLHTHRHRTPRDAAQFEAEIVENRQRLEEATGRTAEHLAYPSGVHRPEFLGWLGRMGVRSAVTTENGLATAHHNQLLLPRVGDHEHLPEVEFHAWLSGVRDFLPSRVNYSPIR